MFRKTVLDNGVRILSERLDHFRSVSLGIWVNAGSREEMAQENGISHFIEHMIFKGTHTRNSLQIAKQLDAIGGFSNAFTGKEHTCFYSKVLDRHFTTMADILSDIFLNSLFEPQDMDRERQVILQEISMVEDTPDEQIHVLFNQLFWMNHPLGMSILGTDKTVSTLNKANIIDYIGRFYTPERIIIAAAGNLDHDQLLAFFRPLFEPLKPSGQVSIKETPSTHPGIACHFKETEQVHICLGGKAPHLLSDKRFAGAVFNTILGGNMSSRLFQEIREKRGLAYSVYSFLTAYVDTGLLGVYVGTSPSAVNEVLELIKIEVKKVRDGALSKDDLAAAKEHLIGGILLGAESTDSRMMRIAKNEYVLERYMGYDELIRILDKVTLDELVDIATEAFEDDKISLTTLGPFEEKALDVGCLQFSDN
ncbi:MAG: insulinase family protein [Deltaproteobacteria bacterium]|nr:insulinase family protein [Deltaproteobacteria bacterium]